MRGSGCPALAGARRQTTLGVFPDGQRADSWLVVASNAGSAKHPAWYYNLAKHPDQVWIELGTEPGREIRVQPESLKGEEREAACREIVGLARGYATYQSQTDRQIPSYGSAPSSVGSGTHPGYNVAKSPDRAWVDVGDASGVSKPKR